MFFGAGNLLFPPYLGLVSGQSWIVSLIGFVLADVGLALLVMAASAKCSGDLDKVLNRVGKNTSKLIGIAAVLCIGPLLAIPRTAATTFEMGITPILGEMNITASVIFSIIFFGLTLALTIRPSKVVDIIGKVLTPTLLIVLAILIIKGIITPIGDLNPEAMIENNPFQEGISQGYLTMGALGAAALATVIITSIHEKGYINSRDKVKLTMKAGLVAGIALTLVYGGLTYLGATLSNLPGNPYGVNTPKASLMVVITNGLFGYPGKIVLCAIVSLACLTTAIGLTSATGKYFSSITNGKLKHPFNGEIFIIGDNKEFELNLLNLSRESCLALATLDWGADNPNLMGISVVNSGYPTTGDCGASMGGGSYLGDIGFWACKYFNEDKIIPIPVPPAIAAKACTCKENTCALGLYYNENL